MAELTTTSHAILGLLARRDYTTYELAQQMQRKLHFVWPRAERKLYEEPRRLVEAGFATSIKDMIGRRARTIYSITPEGRDELKRWLSTPTEAPTIEFDGMVRIMFSDTGDFATLRTNLERIAEQASSERARYEMTTDAANRKNGTTYRGTGPEQRSLEALSKRFMTEHYDRMGEWARWALSEVDGWDTSEGSAESAPNAGVPSFAHKVPDSSMDVVSIDE